MIERMQHPQGKLLPLGIWNHYFLRGLPDHLIPLMQATNENELMDLIQKILPQLTGFRDKEKAWLSIVLSHPEFSAKQIDCVGEALELSPALIFQTAAAWGNEHYFKHLIAEHEKHHSLQAMITADDYLAFQRAAATGQIQILQQLVEKTPLSQLSMIAAEDYKAFVWAAGSGHLDVLNYLIKQAPNKVHHMITAYGYSAFLAAAENGHLNILHYLIDQAPYELTNMLDVVNCAPYRRAVLNNRQNVVSFLLHYAQVFAYAEERGIGTEQYLAMIGLELDALRAQKLALLQKEPDALFDIDNKEKAILLFYIVRNLIRRNDANLQDDILFLLNIPSVKALVNTEVTPHQSNELLRLAKTVGNTEAARVLLHIPAVKQLAEINHYYEKEGGLNLNVLATELNPQETTSSQSDNVPTIHFIWMGSIISEKSDRGPKALAQATNPDGKKYRIIYWVDDANIDSAQKLFTDHPNIEVKNIDEAINHYSHGNEHEKEEIKTLLQRCKEECLPTVAKEILSPILMTIYSGYFLDTSIRIQGDRVNLPPLNVPAIPRNFLKLGGPSFFVAGAMVRSDLYAYYSSENPIDLNKSSDASRAVFTQLASETIKIWKDFFEKPLAIKDSIPQLLEHMINHVFIKPIIDLYISHRDIGEDSGSFNVSNEKIEKEQLITKLPAIATIDNIPTSSTEGSLYVNASFTKIKKLFSGTWRTNFERYLTKRLEQQKLHQKTQDTSSSPDETQTRPRFPK